MARMSKAEKEADRRANKAAQSACVGYQVNIMDLGKVSAKAKEAIAANLDDAAALAMVREYVATIGKATNRSPLVEAADNAIALQAPITIEKV